LDRTLSPSTRTTRIQAQLKVLGVPFPTEPAAETETAKRKRFHADLDKPEELLAELNQLYKKRQHRLELDRDYDKKRAAPESVLEHRQKKARKKEEEEKAKEQLARQALQAAPIWKRLGFEPTSSTASLPSTTRKTTSVVE